MNIHCVITVARQIDGEYILVKSEKAFKDQQRANDYMQSLKNQCNKDGKQIPVVYATPHGDVNCHCEIGVFEVVLED